MGLEETVAALREYASWDKYRGSCQGCAMEDAANLIERLVRAVDFAHSEGFEWPFDPFAAA